MNFLLEWANLQRGMKNGEKTHCLEDIPLHIEFNLLQINFNIAKFELNLKHCAR